MKNDLKQLQEQIDNCRKTANSMLTLIGIYQKQGDRVDSIKQCALEGKRALLLVKDLEKQLDEQINEITAVLAA